MDPVGIVLCGDGLDNKPLGPHLAALLAQLSPLQRSVLRLTVLEGVSMRKAAERLGVAPATVQRVRRQGLERLRLGLGLGLVVQQSGAPEGSTISAA